MKFKYGINGDRQLDVSSYPKFAQGIIFRVGRVMESFGGGSASVGGGSGLWDQTALTSQQKNRSQTLQDTMRSMDSLTWRRRLAYARQIYTSYGEIRAPILERCLLSNAGLWTPRAIGKNTSKRTRAAYEEFLDRWMRHCNVRGHPYDFWTDQLLASISLDRDGEPPVLLTLDDAGNPQVQSIANHRIYSPVAVAWVPDGPYEGMRMNNGVIYNAQARPVAYRVLDPSMQFAQPTTYTDYPAESLYVTWNPDWVDEGRSAGVLAHCLKRSFDMGEIYESQLIAIKRDSKQPLVIENEVGSADDAERRLHPNDDEDEEDFQNAQGDEVIFEDMDDGAIRYFKANTGSKITSPLTNNPGPNVPAFLEVILRGEYQGLPWSYAFCRNSTEKGGADMRVDMAKVNVIVKAQYARLWNIAKHKCSYALACEVAKGNLPPGEWYELDFPAPPEITADIWKQYQEDRENYIIGHETLQNIAARRGQLWSDLRDQHDVEEDDKFQRVEKITVAHKERMKAVQLDDESLTFREVLQSYDQRSPNPSLDAGVTVDEEPGAAPKKK